MTIWYVRPSGGSYGAADGTSYTTAWDGFGNVTWGVGGVVAGDTLYVCGAHNENCQPTDSGSAGSLITIDGQYVPDPGIIDTVSADNGFQVLNRSYIKFQNLTFTDPTSTKAGIRLQRANNIDIENCTFSDVGAEGGNGVMLNPSGGYDVHTVSIKNCSFSNFASAVPIRITIGATGGGGEDGTVYSLTVVHNDIRDSLYGLRFLGTQANVDPDFDGVGISPYGFIFEHNTVVNITRAAVSTEAGLRGNLPNSISYNRFNNIGAADEANVNCLQLHWINNTTIKGNRINSVLTSVADGCGIIIDWNYGAGTSPENYYCGQTHSNTVSHNHITGCIGSGTDGKGISVYRGIDTLIHTNISSGNGLGVRQAGDLSTGNEWYNNTIIDNLADGVDLAANTPTSIWKNNIIQGSAGEGVDDNSTNNPTFTYNILYNNTGGNYSGFTLDGSNIESDALLRSDYSPLPNGPAVDAGELATVARVAGWKDAFGKRRLKGTGVDIGAIEHDKQGTRTVKGVPFGVGVGRSISSAWYTP